VKKLLVQLDSDKHASVFDRIVAHDAGADDVLSYGDVTPGEVTSLVHGAIFTRGPEDLNRTAIWIGGSSVAVGEDMLKTAAQAFFGPLRVSVMMDSNGCNTTAAATVAAIATVEPPAGQRAVVLAGIGPVGLRVAELLARERARVTVVAPWPALLGDRWDRQRAERDSAQARAVGGKVGFDVQTVEGPAGVAGALEGAAIAISAGPLGAGVLGEEDWQRHPTLRVLVDLNPVPPLGIGGIKPGDTAKSRNDRVVFGALGLGGLKMKVHKACVAKLFESREQILDLVAIHDVARSILS
jgi:methylenetetrahydrofolate/methylenetetrahydromethanopterin dehydrogenase (NADP+)